MIIVLLLIFFFFFFNDTATTEIYTLSLHDALPIWWLRRKLERVTRCQARSLRVAGLVPDQCEVSERVDPRELILADRKSTRLNSSHSQISYAVFCLKKKKKIHI